VDLTRRCAALLAAALRRRHSPGSPSRGPTRWLTPAGCAAPGLARRSGVPERKRQRDKIRGIERVERERERERERINHRK
jgi:hypothetical protein